MNISAIILAAGQSKRFGPENKLLSAYKGAPLIHHCLNTLLSGPFTDRILVTGHDAMHIEPHVRKLPVRIAFNPDYEHGMGSSLAAGVNALMPDCEAFMVFLADMPDIPANLVSALLDAYQANSGTYSIIRPVYRGQPGHPVLFSIDFAPQLAKLTGDLGASTIIRENQHQTHYIQSKSAGVLKDIDSKD